MKKALFDMHPEKSPGPDGISPAIYQEFWSIVGSDVIQLVQHFFRVRKFEDHLIDTYIVLIPKKKYSTAMTDLRPISLSNVAYKIISKVLPYGLRRVIDNVISHTQSTFILGRLITDNIIFLMR